METGGLAACLREELPKSDASGDNVCVAQRFFEKDASVVSLKFLSCERPSSYSMARSSRCASAWCVCVCVYSILF